MKFTRSITLVFALLLLGMNYVLADDITDNNMIQKDFDHPYTGLDKGTIINYKPKDCDFQVNQGSKNYTSVFDKTAPSTGQTTEK
jgi:hypothetical protein